MSSLAAFLSRCEADPGRAAIIEGTGRAISFGDLAEASGRLAAAWRRRGLGRGDRVLMALPFGLDLYVGLAAVWRCGAVVVLPEPAMGLQGVRHAARATAPKAFLASGWLKGLRWVTPELWRVPLILGIDERSAVGDPLASLADTAPALISFTSGSTGPPKAIVRSHGLLAAQNAAVSDLLDGRGDPASDLVAFPVFVLANLAVGNTSVLPAWNVRRHDRAGVDVIAAQVRAHRITRALVPPVICETMAESGLDLGLLAIMTGGGPVFPDVLTRLTAIAPGAEITAVYGSTEAEPIAHVSVADISPEDWARMRAGGGLLAGHPVAATSVRMADDEILVTGAHVNKGYLDPSHDAHTKVIRDGEIWHRTGDAGRFDDQGRLWLLGRRDGMVGEMFPFMAEAAARSWPGVRRAALIERAGRPALVIEPTGRPQEAAWRTAAAGIGELAILTVPAIPLDRRHRSKVDMAALRRMVG
ncbi:MAG: AMP-binding protein [Hyphomicrobiaceae bacterium]|nr:AMP-binding protein [Hyphomicrobiaceae bacterium]